MPRRIRLYHKFLRISKKTVRKCHYQGIELLINQTETKFDNDWSTLKRIQYRRVHSISLTQLYLLKPIPKDLLSK